MLVGSLHKFDNIVMYSLWSDSYFCNSCKGRVKIICASFYGPGRQGWINVILYTFFGEEFYLNSIFLYSKRFNSIEILSKNI